MNEGHLGTAQAAHTLPSGTRGCLSLCDSCGSSSKVSGLSSTPAPWLLTYTPTQKQRTTVLLACKIAFQASREGARREAKRDYHLCHDGHQFLLCLLCTQDRLISSSTCHIDSKLPSSKTCLLTFINIYTSLEKIKLLPCVSPKHY